jgi:hypothetical protein
VNAARFFTIFPTCLSHAHAFPIFRWDTRQQWRVRRRHIAMRNTQLEFAKLLFAAYLFAGSVCGFLCLSYETQYTITIFSGFILDLLFFYIISSSCIHFMLSIYFVLMYARYWFKSLPLSDIKFSSNDFYWENLRIKKHHIYHLWLYSAHHFYLSERSESISDNVASQELCNSISLYYECMVF